MSSARPTYIALRSYWHFLIRSARLGLGLTLSCFLLASVAIALIPLFVGDLTSALTAHTLSSGTVERDAGILIMLSLIHQLLWMGAERLYIATLADRAYAYQNELFRAVIHQPYPYFVDKLTGKVGTYISTIHEQMATLTEALGSIYLGQGVSLLILIGILATVSWQSVAIFTVGLILMLAVGLRLQRVASQRERASTDAAATKNGKIFDAVANFQNVAAFDRAEDESRSIRAEQHISFARYREAYLSEWNMWNALGIIIRMLIWPAAIAWNVHAFLIHEITLGQLATVLAVAVVFTTTIWEVIWHMSQFGLNMAKVDEAHRYLFGTERIDAITLAPQLDPPLFSQSLVLERLSFTYPDAEAPVLRDVSLTLQKGEKIGVVGHSGSGKSTLSKLLLGYYPINEEQLLVDERPTDNRALARLISLVPQDTTLFHRTIAENIAYAHEGEVDEVEIIGAAKRAHAHDFISQLGGGYQSLVGERGVKLSAGQRQRIAIARALLDDRPILILDEATSALDSESELLVQRALEALWADRTVIAIAHRLSTLRNMDRIVVLDAGQIVEIGTHEELVAGGGRYAQLWQHQVGGFISDEQNGDELGMMADSESILANV